MRNLSKRYALFIMGLFLGCYGIDNREELTIILNYNHLNSIYFGKYIDSVYNKGVMPPDSVLERLVGYDNKILPTEKIVFIPNDSTGNPDEYFLINLFGSPCVIVSIYNADISKEAIYNRKDLTKRQIERIKSRFTKEVLQKAEMYGLKNHLPDSILL